MWTEVLKLLESRRMLWRLKRAKAVGVNAENSDDELPRGLGARKAIALLRARSLQIDFR